MEYGLSYVNNGFIDLKASIRELKLLVSNTPNHTILCCFFFFFALFLFNIWHYFVFFINQHDNRTVFLLNTNSEYKFWSLPSVYSTWLKLSFHFSKQESGRKRKEQ